MHYPEHITEMLILGYGVRTNRLKGATIVVLEEFDDVVVRIKRNVYGLNHIIVGDLLNVGTGRLDGFVIIMLA